MLLIEVDTGSPVPPYEQLRAHVATMIASGTLPADAQLPTIRQLASDLGLATGTVGRAYRELETEGLIVSRGRHGTRVSARPPALSKREVQARLADAARTYVQVARQLGATDGEISEGLAAELR